MGSSNKIPDVEDAPTQSTVINTGECVSGLSLLNLTSLIFINKVILVVQDYRSQNKHTT
jgi:hypothetical protein